MKTLSTNNNLKQKNNISTFKILNIQLFRLIILILVNSKIKKNTHSENIPEVENKTSRKIENPLSWRFSLSVLWFKAFLYFSFISICLSVCLFWYLLLFYFSSSERASLVGYIFWPASCRMYSSSLLIHMLGTFTLKSSPQVTH